MSKTKYHRDSNKGRLVLGLTVRLAPYAASYVDNPQQSAPSARAEQNNWRLSAVLVPSTPLFAMTADCSGLHQLPSSTARFRSLLRYRLTVSTGQTGTVADLKQPLETVLVSVATQPSLFSFFFFSSLSLVRLLRLHSVSTTPGQIRCDTDESRSLAKKRSFVLSSIYFACICVTGSC